MLPGRGEITWEHVHLGEHASKTKACGPGTCFGGSSLQGAASLEGVCMCTPVGLRSVRAFSTLSECPLGQEKPYGERTFAHLYMHIFMYVYMHVGICVCSEYSLQPSQTQRDLGT